MSIAKSAADLAMGPAESHNLEIGTMPEMETIPMVGLRVYKAALLAGMVREPFVSVPIATGAYPAATPTAEPEEEPPGFFRGQRYHQH